MSWKDRPAMDESLCLLSVLWKGNRRAMAPANSVYSARPAPRLSHRCRDEEQRRCGTARVGRRAAPTCSQNRSCGVPQCQEGRAVQQSGLDPSRVQDAGKPTSASARFRSPQIRTRLRV